MKNKKIKGLQKRVTDTTLSPQCKKILKEIEVWGYNPKKIYKKLVISRKTFHKHSRRLLDLKYIDKLDGVTRRGYSAMGYHLTHKEYRINGAEVFYELPRGLNKLSWKRNRGRVLSLKHITHDHIILRNKYGITDKAPRFYIGSIDVRCHANGIKVYAPDIYGKDGSEAEIKFLIWIREIGQRLNKIFKINFFKDNELNIRVAKYELAHLDDSMAKEFRKEGKKYYINIDGELRYLWDFSRSVDEGEGVTVGYSHEDQENIVGYQKDILTKPHYKASEVKEILDKQADVNLKLATNIEAHLSVVKEIKELLSVLKRKEE